MIHLASVPYTKFLLILSGSHLNCLFVAMAFARVVSWGLNVQICGLPSVPTEKIRKIFLDFVSGHIFNHEHCWLPINQHQYTVNLMENVRWLPSMCMRGFLRLNAVGVCFFTSFEYVVEIGLVWVTLIWIQTLVS